MQILTLELLGAKIREGFPQLTRETFLKIYTLELRGSGLQLAWKAPLQWSSGQCWGSFFFFRREQETDIETLRETACSFPTSHSTHD